MTRARAARLAAAVAALLVSVAADAGGPLQRLPADYVFPGEGSPGKVTFSHASHVDAKKPNCLVCHPSSFKSLQPGSTASGEAIVHATMEKGAACGACHGKTAFALDSCDMCHK